MVNTFPMSVRVFARFVFLYEKIFDEMRLNVFPFYRNNTTMISGT
jgi:hypothetical protein